MAAQENMPCALSNCAQSSSRWGTFDHMEEGIQCAGALYRFSSFAECRSTK